MTQQQWTGVHWNLIFRNLLDHKACEGQRRQNLGPKSVSSYVLPSPYIFIGNLQCDKYGKQSSAERDFKEQRDKDGQRQWYKN